MLFGNDTFLILKANENALAQSYFRVDGIYSAGVSTIGIAGGSTYDSELPKKSTFTFRNKFYTTTNQEAITSGAIASLQIEPNLGTAVVKDTFTTNYASDSERITPASLGESFSDGDKVLLTTTDTLPDPLTTNTVYYIVNKSGVYLEVSETFGGTPITLTDDGTGTHTISHAIQFDTTKTALDLPSQKLLAFNFGANNNFAEGSTELIKQGISGFWLEWTVRLATNSTQGVSQIKQALNYCNNPGNVIWFVPSKDKLGNIYEVKCLDITNITDSLNFLEVEMKFKTTQRIKEFPDDFVNLVLGNGFI